VGVVYFAGSLCITVDMRKMTGTMTARWFDASIRRLQRIYTTVSGRSFPDTEPGNFTPASSTADGYPDFVLVCQAALTDPLAGLWQGAVPGPLGKGRWRSDIRKAATFSTASP
jgi:hypothetical protein